ncbi:MAG: PilZ domain-containing protein [Deltaproteobacteria bacterium]|nr:PilZ domain-containing protein [Deltaproteobacteria bacterium]
MENKRTCNRKFLKLYLQVSDRETGQLFGHLVDITDVGGQVTSEQPIKTDMTFQLILTLPAETMGTKELHFTATTKWSDKDSESDFYNTGFQFVELSSQNLEIIKNLIEKYCF